VGPGLVNIPGWWTGGVFILINIVTAKAVHVQVATKFESLEVVALVIVSTASGFRLFVVFRPPSSSDNDPVSMSFTSLICECIEAIYRKILRRLIW